MFSIGVARGTSQTGGDDVVSSANPLALSSRRANVFPECRAPSPQRWECFPDDRFRPHLLPRQCERHLRIDIENVVADTGAGFANLSGISADMRTGFSSRASAVV